jgi:uncharacterized membrane protein YjjB (DUF3815 family)
MKQISSKIIKALVLAAVYASLVLALPGISYGPTSIDYALGKLFGYRRWMLPIVALINALVIGLYIGYVLLGIIAGVGDPVTLFWMLTAQNFVPAIIGALVLVPIVKRYWYLR